MYDAHSGNSRVTVTDVDMPFWSMVRFMVKWVVASIPAMILLAAASFGFAVLGMIILAALGQSVGPLAK